MFNNYIPSKDLSGKYIGTCDLFVLNKDIVVLFDEIIIRCYKTIKIPISKKFLNIVKEDSIRVIISPYHCYRTHYIDYYIKNGYLYIKTNAAMYGNRKYAKLQLVIVGERWDTEVINDFKLYIEEKK